MTGRFDRDRISAATGSMLRAWDSDCASRRRDEMAESGVDLNDLPRPWVPGQCPDDLREGMWTWCDAVAGWLNREYVWRPTQLIPPCWPRHPHLANELPVLAFTRWLAEDSLGPVRSRTGTDTRCRCSWTG